MKKTYALLFLLTFGFLLAPSTNMLFAQGDPAGVEYLSDSGLSSQDPRTIAANIINKALTLLGTITLIIIIYGGFKWMTAMGNDDAVGDAKKIIASGVIGLVIILSSYALSTFVINSLLSATNETP